MSQCLLDLHLLHCCQCPGEMQKEPAEVVLYFSPQELAEVPKQLHFHFPIQSLLWCLQQRTKNCGKQVMKELNMETIFGTYKWQFSVMLQIQRSLSLLSPSDLQAQQAYKTSAYVWRALLISKQASHSYLHTGALLHSWQLSSPELWHRLPVLRKKASW